RRPFVVVKCVLREPSEPVDVQVVGTQEAGEELGVASPVRKVRKAKLTPGIDVPIAVAVVDNLDRRSVKISEVLMESGRAPERSERRGILGVLVIERDLGHGEVVVAGSGSDAAVLAPVPVGGLLDSGEAVQDARAEFL